MAAFGGAGEREVMDVYRVSNDKLRTVIEHFFFIFKSKHCESRLL